MGFRVKVDRFYEINVEVERVSRMCVCLLFCSRIEVECLLVWDSMVKYGLLLAFLVF